jgi:hypothetical protein
VRAVVVIVRVALTGAAFGVTDAGEKLQLAPAGNPEQVKLTALAKPFSGVMVTVVVAVAPAVTVPLAGFSPS